MRWALVTGTDHGIGLELARQLLQRGYFVTACRYNPAETQIDALCEAYPDRTLLLPLDVGSDESVQAMAEQAMKNTPQLDMLINDAGILGDMAKTVGDALDFDEMLRVINVNALGALRVTNALSGHLLRGEEKLIVNITSEAGSIQDCWREGWFGYCMSKAANNMQGALLHNTLRQEGGQVIQIHPGHVATYMRGHLDTTASVSPQSSAAGILKIALDTPLPLSDRPLYLDYQGKELKY